MPIDYNEFAQKVKAKYPEYKDVDNYTLATKMVEKYPEYKNQVDLKKKESTELVSKSEKPTLASSSKEVEQPIKAKPVTKKVDGAEIVKGYPSAPNKEYKFENGVWYDVKYTPTSQKPTRELTKSGAVIQKGGAPSLDIQSQYTQIKDPSRVAELNRYFKKQGSTSTEFQTFTGLPGNENREYRVSDGNWVRKDKGKDNWVTITDEKNIAYLNSQFKQDVKPFASKQEVDKAKEYNNLEKQFQNNLSFINSKLVDQSEESVVPKLQQLFPAFKFEQSRPGADRVMVTAPNGKQEEFLLDNYSFSQDKAQADMLRGWLSSNYDPKVAKEEAELRRVEKMTEDQVERTVLPGGGSVTTVTPAFVDRDTVFPIIEEQAKKERAGYYKAKSEQVKEVYNKYSDYVNKTGKVDDLEATQALAELKADDSELKRLNAYQDDIRLDIQDYASKKQKAATYLNDADAKLRRGEITQEQYDLQYKPQIEQMEADLKSQQSRIQSQTQNIDLVKKSAERAAAENYLIQESKGSFGGGVAYSAIKGLSALPRLALGIMGIESKDLAEDTAKEFGLYTTKEYMESEERSDLAKAAFSLTESLVAMGAGGSAKAVGSLALYGMGYYEMKDELDQVEGMTEQQKMIMAGAYGIVSAALERFGLEAAVGKINSATGKSIKMGIMKNVFSSLPKDASKEVIEAAVMNETKKYLTSAGLDVVGGMVAEGTTEALQSLSSAGMKELYDLGKETEYFNNEGAAKVFEDALYEGYLGALGGGIMSGVYNATQAGVRGLKANSNELKLLMQAAETEGMNSAVLASVKADMLSGKITKEQAKTIVDNFQDVKSKVDQMPDGITTEGKSVALSLMTERDELNKQIAGKDPNLVKPQTERINEINNSLQQIPIDYAVQEQSADEVSVQSGAGVSTEMEEGVSEAKPEGVTGEIITEEVKVEEPKGEQPQAEVTQEEIVQEKLTVNPSEGYSFEYESENDIPAELKGVEPTVRTETEVGTGEDAKTKLKLTFTGQQLIDAGLAVTPEQQAETVVQPEVQETVQDQVTTEEPIGDANILVDTGIKAGKTDAEIRKEGRAAGLTNKEITEALSKYYTKEQGVFMKSGIKGTVGQFIDGARKFKQKYLTTKGLLPKVGFTYAEKMEGEISSEANRAAKTAKKFGVMFDKFKGDKDLLKDDFDKVLRGDKSIQLPAEFAGLANQMRNHIDRLSQMLIDSGAVDADMAETIKNNIGTYITRSYEIYDNKNFRQKVGEKELQAAKNFLRTQPGMIELAQSEAARTDVTVDKALDALVDNKIDEYFADAKTGALIKGSKLGSKDLSTLKERKEIPEQIRMLMGEYSDPAMNYARTVLNIATLAARHKFLTQVKEAGMGKFFFDKNDSQKPKGFDTEIVAEGSDTMSPLNGLRTTPEIAEAFGLYKGQKGEDGFVQQAFKLYYKAMGMVKWLKTIASFGTHAKNVFSNLGFVGLNGHSLAEIAKSAKVVLQDLKTMTNPEIEAKIDEYIKAGIMRQGAGINEIKDMFKDADMDDFLERRLSMKQPKGVMGKIKQAISSRSYKIKRGMEDLYQAEDDMFKIAAYETEINRYADALYNKPKDQLTDKERQEVSDIAANNVKNTYPTYSRIPEGIKQLRKFPLFIGSFISFQAESYRTAYNTIALAKNELSSDNEKIRKIGARRIAGAMAYLTAKTAILSYAGYAAGTGFGGVLGALFDDDDEEKKQKDVRSFLPPWSKNSDLIVLKADNGEIVYIDFSASDPHGGINKVLNAFFSGEDLLDSFKQSTLELVGQFQGPDILTNLAIQLKGNENDFGKPIYNEEDTFEEKTEKIIDYVYKVIEPGTFTSIRKTIGSEQSAGELAFGETTGLKIRKSDVKDQFGYKLAEFDESFKNARKIYNTEYYKTERMLEDPKATEKEIEEQKKITEEALVRANNAYAEKAKELMDLINSANKLGVDYDELIDELESIKSTMGKERIREMEKGGTEFVDEKRF